nr:MAG TPA: hypothetical protein [Caudoviricetes sp.]
MNSYPSPELELSRLRQFYLTPFGTRKQSFFIASSVNFRHQCLF